ncbi:MAG: sigma-70 family RNA polymerase sigma factor [Planctomycetota bacterium]
MSSTESVRLPSPELALRRFATMASAEAFRAMVEQTEPTLIRRARRLGVAAADVDDVVQETFLAALRSASSFDAERRVSSWLIGILARKAADVRRTRRRQLRVCETNVEPPAEPPSERLVAEEDRRALATAMCGLPAHYRQVLELRYLEHLNAAAIARCVGVPASTVRTWIARGLERLRESLAAPMGAAARESNMARRRRPAPAHGRDCK